MTHVFPREKRPGHGWPPSRLHVHVSNSCALRVLYWFVKFIMILKHGATFTHIARLDEERKRRLENKKKKKMDGEDDGSWLCPVMQIEKP